MRERERSSPSASCRVRVYSRPILSRRRHFAPFIDPAPTHSPAFPATFLFPDEPAACTSCARHRIFPSSSSSAQISPVSESPTPFVYRATRPSRYRSRTDSSLQPFVHAISHPVRTDLHRATEDRIIETPLKRKGEKSWRCMRHSAFYGRERSPLSDPQQRAAARPPPSAPSELQRSPAGFCRTLQIFRLAGIDGNPFTRQL